MYKKILIAVDGSGTSRRGLVEGIRLAKETGAGLLLLYVLNGLILESEIASTAYYQALADSLRVSGTKILDDAATLAYRSSGR